MPAMCLLLDQFDTAAARRILIGVQIKSVSDANISALMELSNVAAYVEFTRIFGAIRSVDEPFNGDLEAIFSLNHRHDNLTPEQFQTYRTRLVSRPGRLSKPFPTWSAGQELLKIWQKHEELLLGDATAGPMIQRLIELLTAWTSPTVSSADDNGLLSVDSEWFASTKAIKTKLTDIKTHTSARFQRVHANDLQSPIDRGVSYLESAMQQSHAEYMAHQHTLLGVLAKDDLSKKDVSDSAKASLAAAEGITKTTVLQKISEALPSNDGSLTKLCADYDFAISCQKEFIAAETQALALLAKPSIACIGEVVATLGIINALNVKQDDWSTSCRFNCIISPNAKTFAESNEACSCLDPFRRMAISVAWDCVKTLVVEQFKLQEAVSVPLMVFVGYLTGTMPGTADQLFTFNADDGHKTQLDELVTALKLILSWVEGYATDANEQDLPNVNCVIHYQAPGDGTKNKYLVVCVYSFKV